jgi:hypothetical protein
MREGVIEEGITPGRTRPAYSGSARESERGEDARAIRSREDRRLLERYHREGDLSAREALVDR